MDREQFFRDARDDLDGPLHGVRVLDVTKVWSGPLATCVLADLGADVVRVELPGGRDGEVPPAIPGTGLSWFRESVNRNKRSVGADLRTDEGRRTLLSLVRVADVLVENYRPGVLEGWGVGYAQCRAVRPELVYVSVSGWGQYGPGIDRSAYDPVVQADGGWMALNGPPDGQPVRAPTFLADELAGLHAAIAALGALAHRWRTGEGQHVDVAMLDSLLFSSSGLLSLAAAGAPPQRMGNQTDFVVPANVYHCRDGDIYLAVSLNRHWRRLAELMGRPELARDPAFATNRDRLANRSLVNAIVAGWCATVTVSAAVAALTEAGLAVSQVRKLRQVADDPQVRARQMLQRTRLHNGTEAELTGPAAKFSRTPTRIRRAAPAAGADTAEVLEEWAADA
ncbi:CaiB/BaiF CoA transferase family protein [Micromonospora sp. DT48]|uniref:CaiB/BaiF CoA transferase family protein n=1 Tax=unclassified Micromonospora TaxID=2617518 RepID=UPI0012BD0B3B|nr:CoA transferase [Micromonospora sp. CP22]MTK01482.1 CoA transferase [Micromonospora sp. CP22]